MHSVISKFKSFHRNEDGIATVWAIFWMIICFALSGLAIDTANAWKVKQILQSTADSSSVSAAMEFYFTNPEDDLEDRVKLVANAYADANMNQNRYGDVLSDESIILGYWDGSTFTPDFDGSTIFPNAVRVITEQVDKHSLGTYFLRFISIFGFDIRAISIAAVQEPGCDGSAILSIGNVMIEGQNSFFDYCIYGRAGVDVQASNYFGAGAYVGMDDILDCGSGRSFKSHCYIYEGNPEDDSNKDLGVSPATSEGFDDALWAGMGHGEPASLNFKLDASYKFLTKIDAITELSILEEDIKDLIDDYLVESIYGLETEDYPGDTIEESIALARIATQTGYLVNDKVEIVPMDLFVKAEASDDPYNISLFDVIVDDVPSIGDVPDENYVAFKSGTTYIVDCSQLDNKMNMGGSDDANLDISGIAIIGLDCDYTFDSSISYSSAFITTTSTSGLNPGGRASISSSSGAHFGTAAEYLYDVDGELVPTACEEDRFTLLSRGSMKIGAQLTGSNFDLVLDGAVNLASESILQEPEPHVGSSITARGDVHIASHHMFTGCGPWTLNEDDLGVIDLRALIVL